MTASRLHCLLRGAACVLTLVAGRSVPAADDSVVIRGGRIVDGTGNPAYFADVMVRHGRTTAIGKLAGAAPTVIDATGLTVAPGFIDVHTHADDIAQLPLAENFVRMGVTTIVTGNCGSSALDVAEFFRRVEATNVSVNVATVVGHNSVRTAAMNGRLPRTPTPIELAKMRGLVEKAMQDGALGLSTGLIYQPGTFASTEEIIELAKVAGAYDGLYASHLRSETTGIYQALDEVFRIAREAGVRAEISHLKLATKPAWGQANKVPAASATCSSTGCWW